MTARAAVFLDRDGTLNASLMRDGRPHPPASLAEMVILPGVAEAIRDFRGAGYLTIVVTNQPDIARGTQSRDVVDGINLHMKALLGFDDVRVCPHTDTDNCACRKPKPGLLIDAARDWHIDLSRSFMIGDRWRDVEAGRAAGCRTFLIDADYDERRAEADWNVASVAEACALILNLPNAP